MNLRLESEQGQAKEYPQCDEPEMMLRDEQSENMRGTLTMLA